ncbi:TRAP transporter large permease [Limnochorda pilosa]|uniref:C4-dicarboxylate ABC transporter permease n=1 Tax=Limnochorda pilosa TaxID=1555112 RepID=A0A0K2SGA1_LIMPI|nr:TRAP transporter large permease [Limnochorda pilosa]BAS26120.1 C4-dicarboxylate ABC transporter permease [Limnochorda pilosa]
MSEWAAALLVGSFALLLLLRAPIAVALGLSSVFTIWIYDLGIPVLSYNVWAGIAKFPLLAIPFFILAGVIMEKAGMAGRIVHFIRLLVGHLPGGLALAAVGVALFWGAVSGSGPATVAALGTILIPGMARVGYDRAFATAVVAATSELSIVIPPSIALIVYGTLTSQSVGTLFVAGVVPGLVVGALLGALALVLSIRRGYGGEEPTQPGQVWEAFKEAGWGLLAPVIILGGIYGGVFTPTEAAAVAVFYGLFVGLVVYRSLSLRSLYRTLVEATISTSVIMIVVTLAGIFSWTASTIGVIDRVTQAILALDGSPLLLLLVLNLFLLVVGMFLDAISVYYIFLPIFIPVMAHLGWNPIWFGIMMTVNLALGQITPPVAVNLYMGAHVAGLSLEEVWREVWRFAAAAAVGLLIVAYVPQLSLWLPWALGMR